MKSVKKAVRKAAAQRKAAAAKKTARRAAATAPPAPSAPSASPNALLETGRLVRIRGLGPIAAADIRLRPLTVFAGENGTGKSFACKAIYSFFAAMGENHAAGAFRGALNLMERSMDQIKRRKKPPQPDAGAIERAIAEMGEAAKILRAELGELSGGDVRLQLESIEASRPRWRKICRRIWSAYRRVDHIAQNPGKPKSGKFPVELRREVEFLDAYVNHLSETSRKKGEGILADGMRANVLGCLGGNFQASVFPRRWMPFPSEQDAMSVDAVEVEGGGLFYWDKEGRGCFQLPPGRERRLPDFSRLIFLDSPVYWRLRDVLEKLRLARRESGRGTLDGVPQYFYDLAAQLREKEPQLRASELCEHLDKLIGGKVILTESGELRFHEKDTGRKPLFFSMHNTAGGKVNLGMLSFLVDRGIIAPGALVFVDEPESNLHPAWQEEMAEALARLADAGVHVVVATHSDWMLSTFANIVRRGELGENGGGAALRKEQVGVWLFERKKKSGGATARELRFDSASGYIPDYLRKLSDDMHNETADLLDELDERGRAPVAAEGGGH